MQASRKRSGFTLPELLVAGVLAASFFTAAAMIYQNITSNRDHVHSYQEVVFPSTNLLNNYYGLVQDRIFAYGAPSYGRAAMAEGLRDRFWEDVERASGVFCLARSTQENEIHPTDVIVPLTSNAAEIDTHEAFLQLLIDTDANAALTFSSFRNLSTARSGSVFIVQPDLAEDRIGVRAIYDIDLVVPSSPPGVYASVRRYVGTTLTNYYDTFYPDVSPESFGPLFAVFEKRSRLNYPELSADKFKAAKDAPFFFMWWPDPALPAWGEISGFTVPDDDPRSGYVHMSVRTGLFFTVPVYPALF